jgi:hypothetical protein
MENNYLSISFSNRPDLSNRSTIKPAMGPYPIPRPLPSQTRPLPLVPLTGHHRPNSRRRAGHTLSASATSMPICSPAIMSHRLALRCIVASPHPEPPALWLPITEPPQYPRPSRSVPRRARRIPPPPQSCWQVGHHLASLAHRCALLCL